MVIIRHTSRVYYFHDMYMLYMIYILSRCQTPDGWGQFSVIADEVLPYHRGLQLTQSQTRSVRAVGWCWSLGFGRIGSGVLLFALSFCSLSLHPRCSILRYGQQGFVATLPGWCTHGRLTGLITDLTVYRSRQRFFEVHYLQVKNFRTFRPRAWPRCFDSRGNPLSAPIPG